MFCFSPGTMYFGCCCCFAISFLGYYMMHKKTIIAVCFSWTTSHNLHWRCHLIIFIDDLVESMSFKLYENIITRAMWYNLGVFHLFYQFSDKCKMTWIILCKKSHLLEREVCIHVAVTESQWLQTSRIYIKHSVMSIISARCSCKWHG